MNLFERTPLGSLMMLLEARDDFLVQTFGKKLIDKIAEENQRGMPIPNDLIAAIQAEDDQQPANKIVAWFVANDPIQGKGSQWMIVQYIRGNYQLEDIDHVKHTLTEFVRVRTQLTVKDLGQYKTLQSLNDALEPFQDKKVVSKREARKSTEIDPAIKPEINIIKDTGDLLICIPTTHKASMYLASTDFMGSLTGYRAANWCTARTTDHYFTSHTSQGPLYFIFIKDGPDAGKYQFHFETKQFNTSANVRIPELRAWLIRNPEIRQTFDAKAAELGLLEFMSPETVQQYRQQYIDSGVITQLLSSDKVTVLFIPDTQRQLHPYMVGEASTKYSKWTSKSNKVSGPFTYGVIYITLANHTMFTYKLGYASCLHNDTTPYPIKTLLSKIPELKELIQGMLRDAGVDTTDQTDPAVQQLVASGAAKQIFSSDALTVWWMNDIGAFQQYFGATASVSKRMYSSQPMFSEAGIMILDVGSSIVSYRLGDNQVYHLDMDELAGHDRGYTIMDKSLINKFMLDNPATTPIIKKYADHYGYYPLMTDKGKAKHMDTMVEKGTISIIKKDSPSVIQLLSGDSVEMIRPLISAASNDRQTSIKQMIAAELQRGPVYLIQGTILFVSSIGGTYQINSNNNLATMSTQQVFERFPALRDILKDDIAAAGVSTGQETPLADTVTALARTGAIVPISPNPLVLKLTSVIGTRWFIEHHNGGKSPMSSIYWGKTGIVTPYNKPLTAEGDTSSDAAIDTNTHAYGFIGKGNTPLILSIKRPVGGTQYSLNIYKTFDSSGSGKGDILTSQGVVAFMQKYPEVLRAISPHLRGLAGTPQELTATTSSDANDPHAKAANAVTGIMKSTKAYGDAGRAQSLSELNANKFLKNCYTAAAYLKQYASQFTPDQAVGMADRIINATKYVSRDSLRTMPPELAEWLKYATQLSPDVVERIVTKYPMFIAGLRPAPYELMHRICNSQDTSQIELARAYAKMDPADEARLDRELMRSGRVMGINYNNVVADVTEMIDRHGVRTAVDNTLRYLRNLPTAIVDDYLWRTSYANISKFYFPPEGSVIRAFQNRLGLATAKSGGVPFYRRTPKVREAVKYIRQHGSLTGFAYTPPAPVVLPAVPGAPRPVAARQTAPTREAPRAAAQEAPRTATRAPAAGFATKAAHARHIIDNRTPEDTRTTLIGRLINDVGLTPAGAATYYYNLTRAAVREGEEDLDLFMMAMRLLG